MWWWASSLWYKRGKMSFSPTMASLEAPLRWVVEPATWPRCTRACCCLINMMIMTRQSSKINLEAMMWKPTAFRKMVLTCWSVRQVGLFHIVTIALLMTPRLSVYPTRFVGRWHHRKQVHFSQKYVWVKEDLIDAIFMAPRSYLCCTRLFQNAARQNTMKCNYYRF